MCLFVYWFFKKAYSLFFPENQRETLSSKTDSNSGYSFVLQMSPLKLAGFTFSFICSSGKENFRSGFAFYISPLKTKISQ